MRDEEELSEKRRREIIEQIRISARTVGVPDFDVESRLAGHLAGPVSEDRPDVPVWEYLDYGVNHPAFTVEDIVQVRFPVAFLGGETTVASIAEELRPDPVSAPPRPQPTAEEIVERYAMMHQAQVLGWNAQTRTVEYLKPQAEYRAILEQWWANVRSRRAKES
jgi:hypothetical protein